MMSEQSLLPTDPPHTPAGYQHPKRGAQTEVFISYSRKDRGFVTRLFESLEVQGRAAWVDWESIPYSVDWWQEIQDGIDSANNVICVISPAWLTSEMCHKEFAYASERGKRIIPIIRIDSDAKAIKAQWIDKPWEQQARANLEALKKINWLYCRKKSDGHVDTLEAGAADDQPANDLDNFDKAYQDLIKTLETDDDHVRRHTRLLMRAREWENFQRDDSYLLRDLELDAAQAWLNISAGKQPEPTALHREYITRSTQYHVQLIVLEIERKAQLDRSARRARRFGQIATAVGMIATGLVIGATVFAANRVSDATVRVSNANVTLASILPTLTAVSGQIADGEARIVSLDMASAAEAIMQEASPDKTLAVMLAIRGLKKAYTEQADAVLSTLAQCAVKLRNLNQGFTYNAVFSPDGNHLVIAEFSGNARLWDITTWESIDLIIGVRVFNAIFAPDSKTTLTYSEDRIARLWNVEDGTLLRVFPHTRGINQIAFAPDGKTILTVTADNVIHDWDVVSGAERFALQHSERVAAAEFSLDGALILSRTEGNTARLWDAQTGKELHILNHEDAITSAVFSPDGKTVLTGSHDNTARLWEVATGVERFRLKHSGYDGKAVFSPDGKVILTRPSTMLVSLWDAQAGRLLHDFASPNIVQGAIFSPNSQQVAVSSNDHAIRLWDVLSGNVVRTFSQPETAKHLQFSPNGKVLLAIPDDRITRLWEVETGKALRVLTQAHTVSSAVFSPDSTLVLTSNVDGARLWETYYADFLADACSYISRDFNDEERKRYNIPKEEIVCDLRNEASKLPPNPLLPPTTTPWLGQRPVATVAIPTYTPSITP